MDKPNESRLRRLRNQAQLSQEKLAQQSGVCLRTITQIESGRGMRVSTARKIAKALGCSLEELTAEVQS